MKKISILKIFIILLLIFIVSGTGFIIFIKNQLNNRILEDNYILIKNGEGLNKIIDKLDEIRIVKNKIILKAIVYYKTRNKTIKYGEYFFEKNLTLNDIIEKLINNKVHYRTITFAEGLSVNSIKKILVNNEFLTGELPENIPEGSLLPETYTFQRGDTRESIIKRMQKDMVETINKYWITRDRNLPFNTKAEALILASIVEKETGIASERPLVASVFINRMRINMPLQSDPTAVYGYAFGDIEKEKEIKTSFLVKQDNLYNTYKIRKLPPTPICNPGKDAIKAVLNPAKTKYIFFVATGNGGHNFSENYLEHRKFVEEYRKIKNKEANQ